MTMNQLIAELTGPAGLTVAAVLLAGTGLVLALGLLRRERRRMDDLAARHAALAERCDLQQLNLVRLGQQVAALRRASGAAALEPVSPPAAGPRVAPRSVRVETTEAGTYAPVRPSAAPRTLREAIR